MSTQHADEIEITQNLIRCPSVTPKDEGAQVYLTEIMEDAGFTVHSLPFGVVPNIFAVIGDVNAGRHIGYGGHTDVVPPGPVSKWTHDPFDPVIEDGIMYGRGTSDMKGSVACFTAAAINYVREHGVPENGAISLLITGDEEGPAHDGTVKVLEWMEKENLMPDVFLVGEPTNPSEMGQEMKIGRRGSLNGVLTVEGKQGHVAYPERADNPMPRLIAFANALVSYELDNGTEFFVPSNLEITSIDVGNEATNVVPDSGQLQFNIRYNDTWSYDTLDKKLREVLDSVGGRYDLQTASGAESFMTEPGEWTAIVQKAVHDVCGRKPELTTTGGTSDARFTAQYAPTIEFGPINDTIHQIDENARVQDLKDTAKVYRHIIDSFLK